MLKEFKKFIVKGNAIDLAIGVVVGSAFTGIVNSLVNNIIMPFVGVLTAGVNFKDISINLTPLARFLGNEVIPNGGIHMSVGLFINSIVEFLIIALTLFIIVKAINVSREKMESIIKKEGKEETTSKEKEKTDEVKLLEEIRDLLQSND
ncbi:MAG: large conductance mechanosensitive channel protein MscL [Bacilli bacterium]|nr:large conductance mechanosensitive channel protein MscL [Bacilli bacterium]